MEQDIFEMLGLGATEYERYIAQEPQRIVCLQLPNASSGPELDIIAI